MLLVTSLLQGAIFVATGSVALLADLIHNFGDALTAIPLGIAFVMRSFVAEKRAGYFVVATIFISACVAAATAVERLINPQTLDHLGILAAAGAIGFVGNEIAARNEIVAQIRLRAGGRRNSPALTADGNHARTDGLVITLVILRITCSPSTRSRPSPGCRRVTAVGSDEEVVEAIDALLAADYPPAAIHYYRGGLHGWISLGLPTEPPSPPA